MKERIEEEEKNRNNRNNASPIDGLCLNDVCIAITIDTNLLPDNSHLLTGRFFFRHFIHAFSSPLIWPLIAYI